MARLDLSHIEISDWLPVFFAQLFFGTLDYVWVIF
jgi:hypothetical protein